MKTTTLKLALASVLGLSSLSSLAATELENLMKDDNQWAHPRKDYANTGYSRLSQINKGNVRNLKMAWSFATGVNRWSSTMSCMYIPPSPTTFTRWI